MNLTALEIVRIIVALEQYQDVDGDWIEDLQVKIIENCLPKDLVVGELLSTDIERIMER